jgi:hypothetical protein
VLIDRHIEHRGMAKARRQAGRRCLPGRQAGKQAALRCAGTHRGGGSADDRGGGSAHDRGGGRHRAGGGGSGHGGRGGLGSRDGGDCEGEQGGQQGKDAQQRMGE